MLMSFQHNHCINSIEVGPGNKDIYKDARVETIHFLWGKTVADHTSYAIGDVNARSLNMARNFSDINMLSPLWIKMVILICS